MSSYFNEGEKKSSAEINNIIKLNTNFNLYLTR